MYDYFYIIKSINKLCLLVIETGCMQLFSTNCNTGIILPFFIYLHLTKQNMYLVANKFHIYFTGEASYFTVVLKAQTSVSHSSQNSLSFYWSRGFQLFRKSRRLQKY